MTAKRILFGPLPPPYGGVAIVMSSLKDSAIDRGAEVWSYAGDGGDPRVRRVNHRRFGHVLQALTLDKGSRILDSSHFHLEYPHRLLVPAWLWAKKQERFTWVKACHDGSLPFRYDTMTDAQKARMAKSLEAVDELVVSSPALVDFFRDKYDGELHYISPLLPTEQDLPSDAANVRETGKGVLSIGAFIPSYGFHEVAEAVETLRRRGRKLTLTLLDGAFARDGKYRRDLLAGREWITVREGVPHAQVGKFLASADVFVRAFAHESYGLSRVEAILAGTPVIATDIGETRGMLTYHSGDAATLCKHLETVLDSGPTDLSAVAEMYKEEAHTNLRAYLQVLDGGGDA